MGKAVKQNRVEQSGRQELPADLKPIEDWAKEENVRVGATGRLPVQYELAGMKRLMNWFPGKQVSRETFMAALKSLRRRPQGGGGGK